MGDAHHQLGHQGQVPDGEHRVHRQQCQKRAAQHEFQPNRETLHQLLDRRVDEKDDKIGQHAPGQRHPQAYPSLEVKTELGIIPVLHMGGGLQHPAHQILPGGHDCHSHHIEEHQILLQRREEQDHQHHAAAVNRADRAVKESSGHQALLYDGAIAGLHHPAQKRVQDKIEEQAGNGKAHKIHCCCPPSSSVSSTPSNPLYTRSGWVRKLSAMRWASSLVGESSVRENRLP